MATAEKKYELLTNDTVPLPNGEVMYRIRALKDVDGVVRAGELGGYIESEDNLAQEGNCWVYENCYVLDDARVSGDAIVYGKVFISQRAQIGDDAALCGYIQVGGDTQIGQSAYVLGDAKITGNDDIIYFDNVDGRMTCYCSHADELKIVFSSMDMPKQLFNCTSEFLGEAIRAYGVESAQYCIIRENVNTALDYFSGIEPEHCNTPCDRMRHKG